ncbi:hypothetical protein OZX60_03400 [Streptococcaceae bacterium ESL0687]|nr:hypothetical protein OZX60_03400 [Streptococcaceae bacterium ESL0687]
MNSRVIISGEFLRNIISWFELLHFYDNYELAKEGLANMRRDINKAIDTNTPLETIPEDIYNKIIF